MPAVNLNRLYRARASERRPVLDSPNIPDAAGAMLRATLPAQRARLQIAGDQARREQARIRDRYEGIATGLRVFSDTFNAFERARERQDADAIRKAQNAARADYLKGEESDYATRYRATGDGENRIVEGPLSAVRKRGDDFLAGNEAYKALRPEAKEAFEEWFATFRAEKENSAAREQGRLQRADREAELNLTETNLDSEIEQLLARGDYEAWAEKTAEAAKFKVGRAMRSLGHYEDAPDGGFRVAKTGDGQEVRPLSESERKAFDDAERNLLEKYNIARLEYLKDAYMVTGDPEALEQLKAWGMTAAEYEAQAKKENGISTDIHPDEKTEIRNDSDRSGVRAWATDAEAKWEARETRRMMEEDRVTMDGAKLKLLDILDKSGDAPIDAEQISALRSTAFHDRANGYALNAYIDEAIADHNDAAIFRQIGEGLGLKDKPASGPFAQQREAAKNIQDPKMRQAALATIDSVEAAREFEAWDRDYVRAVGQLEQMEGFDEGSVELQQFAIANVVDAIGDLGTEAAREMAMKRVAGVQNELGAYYSKMAIDVLNQGWFIGRDGRPQRLSNREAIDIYSRYIPYMTRQQMDAVHEAFGKVRVNLSQGDFDGLQGWLETHGLQLSELYSWEDVEKTGKMAVNGNLIANGSSEAKALLGGPGGDPADLAREIWGAVEQYKRLQTILQGRTGGGAEKTLTQYLDEYFAGNQSRLDLWKQSTTSERVAETRNIFMQYEVAAVYGPFSGDEEPEEPYGTDE